MKLVDSLRPRTVLEIGAGFGGTLLLFARTSSPDANIVTVDLPPGFTSISLPKWRESLIRSFARFDQNMAIVREKSHAESTFAEIVSHLREVSIDVLFS